MNNKLENLAWQKSDGLLPAIIQDIDTLQVLMLGYMNLDALKETLKTGKVTFYSRSKQRLWTKGETSKNYLHFVSYAIDCDQDAILIFARPDGVTCHLGTQSCFGENKPSGLGFINTLENIINQRVHDTTEKSYTASLMKAGVNRVAQKIGEEGVEVALAAVGNDKHELLNESADLLYHLLVLLNMKDSNFAEVVALLEQRNSKEKSKE